LYFESNVTGATVDTGTPTGIRWYLGNTLYGAENKLGVGINFGTADTGRVINNIIYGFTTGISATSSTQSFSDYNDMYNNTTDVTNWIKGRNGVTVNPSFTNVGQVTGTTGAFVAGNNKLVDTNKNFTTAGVVAGDTVLITGGTGAPSPSYHYLIDSISTTTNPNDTLNITIPAGPGTNTTADKTYQITIGHNFAVGPALKAAAFPGAINGTNTTGYTDTGAVQRQEGLSGYVFGG